MVPIRGKLGGNSAGSRDVSLSHDESVDLVLQVHRVLFNGVSRLLRVKRSTRRVLVVMSPCGDAVRQEARRTQRALAGSPMHSKPR